MGHQVKWPPTPVVLPGPRPNDPEPMSLPLTAPPSRGSHWAEEFEWEEEAERAEKPAWAEEPESAAARASGTSHILVAPDETSSARAHSEGPKAKKKPPQPQEPWQPSLRPAGAGSMQAIAAPSSPSSLSTLPPHKKHGIIILPQSLQLEGDWECVQCGHKNRHWRTRCHWCAALKCLVRDDRDVGDVGEGRFASWSQQPSTKANTEAKGRPRPSTDARAQPEPSTKAAPSRKAATSPPSPLPPGLVASPMSRDVADVPDVPVARSWRAESVVEGEVSQVPGRPFLAGDWRCTRCRNHNMHWRGFCFGQHGRCRNPRDASFRPGDWYCKCGNHNSYWRTECNRSKCGRSRVHGEQHAHILAACAYR